MSAWHEMDTRVMRMRALQIALEQDGSLAAADIIADTLAMIEVLRRAQDPAMGEPAVSAAADRQDAESVTPADECETAARQAPIALPVEPVEDS